MRGLQLTYVCKNRGYVSYVLRGAEIRRGQKLVQGITLCTYFIQSDVHTYTHAAHRAVVSASGRPPIGMALDPTD